jgi:hypothetical protein
MVAGHRARNPPHHLLPSEKKKGMKRENRGFEGRIREERERRSENEFFF